MVKKRGFRRETEASWKGALRDALTVGVVAASVAILALETELRRELFVAAMDPRDIALIRRPIGAAVAREWEGRHLIDPKAQPRKEAPDALDYAVTESRGIAFALIDFSTRYS